jgi:hypothetical protein
MPFSAPAFRRCFVVAGRGGPFTIGRRRRPLQLDLHLDLVAVDFHLELSVNVVGDAQGQ